MGKDDKGIDGTCAPEEGGGGTSHEVQCTAFTKWVGSANYGDHRAIDIAVQGYPYCISCYEPGTVSNCNYIIRILGRMDQGIAYGGVAETCDR